MIAKFSALWSTSENVLDPIQKQPALSIAESNDQQLTVCGLYGWILGGVIIGSFETVEPNHICVRF
ncbi:MAG: hypothetical protein HOF72_01605 [Planctomycetaceae bacterium]|nr:hypothetical protein [Planctomycetaceae bacterium]MBT4011553.1 hypothetical protein [Planctomycetaceae bacterium]